MLTLDPEKKIFQDEEHANKGRMDYGSFKIVFV